MPVTVLEAVEWMVREHPERTAPRSGWPCCTMIGHALAAAAAYSYDRAWWDAINIVDHTDPWSMRRAVDAVVRHVEGAPAAPGRLIEAEDGAWTDRDIGAVLEALVPGRAHVVQWWWRLDRHGQAVLEEDRPAGHQILWLADEQGLGYRLESSVRDGLRVGGRPWRGGPPPTVDLTAAESWAARSVVGMAVMPLWEGS